MAHMSLSQVRNAAIAGFGSVLLSFEPTFAAARAQSLTFKGNPLWLIGIAAFVILALWLTIVGSLRSDRRDRGKSTSGADRGGPVYADIDGDSDHIHFH